MNFNNQWLIDDIESDLLSEPQQSRIIRRLGRVVREVVQIVVIALLMYVVLNVIIPRYEVEGHSMEPNFYSTQRVVVSRLHYIVGSPQRGDIVVFEHSNRKNLIKRVIGLPGEVITMEEGQVFVDGVALNEAYINELCRTYSCRNNRWELDPDEYFVLGDNRNHSLDSHNFGPIHRDQIVGKVLFRYWPPDDLRTFLDEDY